MAAGLSKAARYGRSYRWAARMRRLYPWLERSYSATVVKGRRPDTGEKVEAMLTWGNMSNGESIGLVSYFVEGKYQGGTWNTEKVFGRTPTDYRLLQARTAS